MNKRMLVDTSMLFVFLLLLDYRYVHNFGHEMLALVFTALFLLHTIWNARWYPALFRGRWPKQRIVMTGIDLLLLFLFLGVMLTGLSFSHTMPIFNIHPPLWVHRLHRLFGFLMLFVMGLHLGIHWQGIWAKMKRAMHIPDTALASLMSHVAALILAAAGVYSSFLYALGSRLLLIPVRSLARPPTTLCLFLACHLSIVILYTVIGYYGWKWASRR